MTGSTPMSRLRERHRGFHYCDGGAMATEQRCDTIAALEELEALPLVSPADLESLDMSMQSIIRHAEGKETEIRALQARINAATVLIRRAMEERRMTFHPTGGIDTCENCRPYREWLGNKEAGNE